MMQQYLQGLAATWSFDGNGNRYVRGCFARTIRLLAAGRIQIPVLFAHQWDLPVGAVIEATETDEGFEILGTFDPELAGAKRVKELTAQPGVQLGMSPFGWHQDRHFRATEWGREVLDGIVTEVSIGTAGQVANPVKRFALLEHQLAGALVSPAAGRQHAPLPDLCDQCAPHLAAMIAAPRPAFELVRYCEHRQTMIEAKVVAGEVKRWNLAGPMTLSEVESYIARRRAEEQRCRT